MFYFMPTRGLSDQGKVGAPDFIRQTLAKAVGFTGPLTTGRKYATPEERKAAGKAKRKAKADLMKRLLAEHQAQANLL